MANIVDFEAPDFLLNQTEEEIHRKMIEDIVAQHPNIDTTEGSFVWDFTRPTAKEKARMVGFTLTEIIKNMFPMWSYGDNLDWQATARGMERKSALKATGTITVAGKAGTMIPEGFIFKTESVYNGSSVLFKTLKSALIPGTGTGQQVDIDIEAYDPGISGNVAAGTITMLNAALAGIEAVSNAAATEGGTDVESDDSLRQRMLDYDQQQGISFIGSDSDYKRWALEIPGVGDVGIVPATAGAETIMLILTDTQGQPASSELCTQVYDHIMSPADREKRKAGINDILSVVPATALTINISATVTIEGNRAIDDIKADFYAELINYYKVAATSSVVRINEIGKILIDIEGVSDYSGLTLNGGNVNISVTAGDIPVTAIANITMVE